ncbi:MAG: YfiR family protein [Vicinamibacterales bacterium]
MTRALAVLLLSALGAGSALPAFAQPGTGRSPSEYEVKAAYLLNFIRFTRWPRAAQGPFEMCLLGADPFGPTLNSTVEAERVGGRPVTVRRLSAQDDRTSCHLLYISPSEEPRLLATLARLDGSDVLTVSDMPGFVPRNGMIQLVTEGGRVRFDANLDAAVAAGLMLSSDLLRVARNVRRANQP